MGRPRLTDEQKLAAGTLRTRRPPADTDRNPLEGGVMEAVRAGQSIGLPISELAVESGVRARRLYGFLAGDVRPTLRELEMIAETLGLEVVFASEQAEGDAATSEPT